EILTTLLPALICLGQPVVEDDSVALVSTSIRSGSPKSHVDRHPALCQLCGSWLALGTSCWQCRWLATRMECEASRQDGRQHRSLRTQQSCGPGCSEDGDYRRTRNPLGVELQLVESHVSAGNQPWNLWKKRRVNHNPSLKPHCWAW
ncbi:mCG60780, isoform CRA_a, partial [Mus musculus]